MCRSGVVYTAPSRLCLAVSKVSLLNQKRMLKMGTELSSRKEMYLRSGSAAKRWKGFTYRPEKEPRFRNSVLSLGSYAGQAPPGSASSENMNSNFLSMPSEIG
ncbi:PP117 [Orf virus]|uniref:PP117 n=1 Tax=Orf virus TaxID=10258 RepID=F1AWX3_ORFV|nr:PP117 [Orf virus]